MNGWMWSATLTPSSIISSDYKASIISWNFHCWPYFLYLTHMIITIYNINSCFWQSTGKIFLIVKEQMWMIMCVCIHVFVCIPGTNDTHVWITIYKLLKANHLISKHRYPNTSWMHIIKLHTIKSNLVNYDISTICGKSKKSR